MTIIEAIKITNGIQLGKQFTLVYGKTIIPKQKSELFGKTIQKISEMNVRLVNYENQKAVKEKRDNGMENCPNNWTKIANGVWQDNNGNFKICVAPSKLKNAKNSSKFLLENNEIEYSEIESHLLAKDKKKNNSANPDWFTLSIENVIEIKA
jgi:hypothetical protein